MLYSCARDLSWMKEVGIPLQILMADILAHQGRLPLLRFLTLEVPEARTALEQFLELALLLCLR